MDKTVDRMVSMLIARAGFFARSLAATGIVIVLSMVAGIPQGFIVSAGEAGGTEIFSDQFEMVIPVAFNAVSEGTLNICAPVDSQLCSAATSVNIP